MIQQEHDVIAHRQGIGLPTLLGLRTQGCKEVSHPHQAVLSSNRVQVHFVLHAVGVHGLIWFIEPKATLTQQLQFTFCKQACGRKSNGIDWAIGHTVSFHVHGRIEGFTLRLGHVQVPGIVSQSVQAHKAEVLAEGFLEDLHPRCR